LNGSRPSARRFQRVLLTGGAGFVGSYLRPALEQAFSGAELVLLLRTGSPERPEGWCTAEAEIFDRAAVGEIVARFRPDLVLHLAAQASVGIGAGTAEDTWRVNFEGSFALASACARDAPDTTFFFVSSAEVYGQSFQAGPVREDTPLRPTNAYARSKAAAEQVLADVLPATARLIVVRSFNHTGPGQDQRFVLPYFAAQIAAVEAGRQPACIKVGNLDAERDFLDVRDVCDAYVKLILSSTSLPPRLTVNVSSGSARRIGDLLAILKSKAICNFLIETDPARLRPSDIPRAVGENEKLRSVVDWRPATPIEETLAALLSYAREKP
jgi:GDP-4-dehydro-6-deoxy-D-mannose reductase